MTDLSIPACITDKLQQLNSFVKEYPDKIPLPAVAKFMGITDAGLRAYIDDNPNSFGMSWRQTGAVNKAYKIPTVRFYSWFRNGI